MSTQEPDVANSVPLNRRKLLKTAAGLAAASAIPAPIAAMAKEARKDRKNVLFIAIDDMRPELGIYNAPLVKSPNLDSFGESGLVFDRAYVHQAICAPSRATLMTGLRPDTTGIYSLDRPVSEAMAATAPIMNRTFKQAGYETVSIGKIYHHTNDVRDGWSEDPYDMYWDKTTRARRMALGPRAYVEGYKWGEAGNLDRFGLWRAEAFEDEDIGIGDFAYADGNNTLHCLQWLHRFAYSQNPFLMCFGFHRPHLPFFAPKKYWDLYDPADITLPDHRQPPLGAPSYALATSGETRNYANTQQDRDIPFTDEFTRRMHHGYLACISYIDTLFGHIMRTLEQLALEKNTIVIVWGDHGYKLGEYGQFNKHSNYEIDLRVPVMVRVPGMVASGQRTKAIIETVDIFPTLLELTDQPVPSGLEGISFAPVLENPDKRWKSAAFSQYPRSSQDSDGTGGTVDRSLMGYTVRTEHYRYIGWVDRETDALVFQELYDLSKDPHETVNIAGNAEYVSILDDMERKRKAGWKAALPQI